MKSMYLTMCLIVCLGLSFWSCEQSKSPTETSSSEQKGQLRDAAIAAHSAETPSTGPCGNLLPQSVALAGYTVTYSGRTEEAGQTTFSYAVSGPANSITFRLELPGCAPALASSSPEGGTQGSEDANINPGIEWNSSSESEGTVTFNYSVTYSGSVREGIVLTSVRASESVEVGYITGACARVFDIGGTAFIDANSNGILDGSETPVPNAQVTLLSPPSTFLCSGVTDASGNYKFEQLPAGNYIIQIDSNTVTSGTNGKYIISTSPTSLNVSVGPNTLSNNFGFYFKTDKLINDLKVGTLPTTGLKLSFWRDQLKEAIRPNGHPVVKKDSLLAYIGRIRTLLLTNPFQLAPGNGLQAALDILSRPNTNNLDALREQLLTLEFNHVSRHGVSGTDAALQLELIGWGEALLANTTPTNVPVKAFTPSVACSTCVATDVYNSINKSSGGGTGF